MLEPYLKPESCYLNFTPLLTYIKHELWSPRLSSVHTQFFLLKYQRLSHLVKKTSVRM